MVLDSDSGARKDKEILCEVCSSPFYLTEILVFCDYYFITFGLIIIV